MQVRYDPVREIYRDCRWCQGRGCLACPAEAKAAYQAAFPEGPKPLATFDISTPGGLEKAKRAIGRAAIEHAFGPEGGGVAEIVENCRKEEDR